MDKKVLLKKSMHVISIVGIVTTVILCVILMKKGYFSSQEKLQELIRGFGIASAVIFIVIQIVQVVIPIIPGGISCLAGVMMFGVWKGFLYNYIGICLGSIVVFLIAKYYGRPILECLFRDKMIKKYDGLLGANHRFTKFFAFAIFFPVAPDDFLCYMAGTTKMSLRTFTTIVLICKPFSIAIYSMGLSAIYQFLQTVIL